MANENPSQAGASQHAWRHDGKVDVAIAELGKKADPTSEPTKSIRGSERNDGGAQYGTGDGVGVGVREKRDVRSPVTSVTTIESIAPQNSLYEAYCSAKMRHLQLHSMRS